MEWRPMTTAPTNGTFILLLGDSGYTTTPFRIEVCRWNPDKERWENHAGDSFNDSGDNPIAWATGEFPSLGKIVKLRRENNKIDIEFIKVVKWTCPGSNCGAENNEEVKVFYSKSPIRCIECGIFLHKDDFNT